MSINNKSNVGFFKKSTVTVALSSALLAGFSFQGIAAEDDEVEKV